MGKIGLFSFLLLTSGIAFSQNTFDFETEVIRLINEHRHSIGMKPLCQSDLITHQAREHSANMASMKVAYGHDGFKQRTGNVRRVLRCGAMGENVTQIFSHNIAESAVRSWLASKGHRENLEKPGYTMTGVGVACSKSGIYYVTQIFAVKDLKNYPKSHSSHY